MKGATDAGKVVKGADVDVGTSVDWPRTEGRAQGLGKAPDVVSEDVPQVAQDGELRIALSDVFVHESGRRRPCASCAKAHAVELGQSLVGSRFVTDHRRKLQTEGEGLNGAHWPGGIQPGWVENGVDKAVCSGVDDGFAGLGLGKSVRGDRHRRGRGAESWGWTEATRTGTAGGTKRRLGWSSKAPRARVVRAAVGASTKRGLRIRRPTLSVAIRTGAVQVPVVFTAGGLTVAAMVDAEALRRRERSGLFRRAWRPCRLGSGSSSALSDRSKVRAGTEQVAGAPRRSAAVRSVVSRH